MKKLLVTACIIATPAFAQAQVCVPETQAIEFFRGAFEMSNEITRQKLEIDALKKFIADKGLTYESAFDRFVKLLQEAKANERN